MKLPLVAALVLQLAPGSARDVAPDPQYQPYLREIAAVATAGQACVALDATVFAHAAQRAGSDLRLYRGRGTRLAEVPYALTESSADAADTEAVAIRNERVHGDVVDLDLRMPDRPWSEIDLATARKNFVAEVRATGSDAEGQPGHDLGTLTIFELTAEGLPASTRLPLAEANDAWVHLLIRFTGSRASLQNGAPGGTIFTGAQIPPSRQAQVLYTTVATGPVVPGPRQQATADLDLAAHVPVERVRFEVDPRGRNFLAHVLLSGSEEGMAAPERFEGDIGRVTRLDPGPGLPPIRYERLTLPVAMGANLRFAAQVHVEIEGKGDGPVPVRRVVLEMRRRSVCFDAQPGNTYTLRYGDAALGPPAYEYARHFGARANALALGLGPEVRNPSWRVRGAARGLRALSPEAVGVLVIAVLALVGVLVVERLRKHGRRKI